MESQTEIKESFKLLVLASMLTVALWFIPFAGVITHPINLFGTFIHETGHALAVLITFGSVDRITMDWYGNGVTWGRSGWSLLVASAGYLSTLLFGSGLLLSLRRARNARTAAISTAALLLLMTLFFAGNSVAWIIGLCFGVALLALGLKAKTKATHFLMSFLAVQAVLNALYDFRTLLFFSAFDPNTRTDAKIMSDVTGGFIPPIIWAGIWSLIAAAMLIGTLVIYYRSLRARAKVEEAPPAALLEDFSSKAATPHL
jgi:peptidase M50B-like protein